MIVDELVRTADTVAASEYFTVFIIGSLAARARAHGAHGPKKTGRFPVLATCAYAHASLGLQAVVRPSHFKHCYHKRVRQMSLFG